MHTKMIWYRVCERGFLNSEIDMANGKKPNWFTDHEGSQSYRNYFEDREDIFIVRITGKLRLVSVAEVVKNYHFKPSGLNILDENLQRINSLEENTLDENNYYDELHKFMQDNHPEFIKNCDGYYTPATETFHVEMILFSQEIINAVNNASSASVTGTPLPHRFFSVRNGDDKIEGTVERLITKQKKRHSKKRKTENKKIKGQQLFLF